MTATQRPPTVGDRMARKPIVIRADAPLSEAVQLLHRERIHGLPVVDGSGSLVGVLSQTDLARARSTEYLWANWPGLAVRHLMTSPPVTVQRSALLTTAARKMERHHIHRLVVVDDEDPLHPIGVLSMTDLIDAIAAEVESGGDAPEPATPSDPGAADD
ncbi:MAG: CBS domain-containing protein [Chloroflexota bacterium]